MERMRNRRVRRRLTAWLASLAVLFAALAPSVSMALSAARGGDSLLLEICSVAGDRSLDDRAGDAGLRGTGGPALPLPAAHAHCPFCLLPPAWLGPPAASAVLPFAAGPGEAPVRRILPPFATRPALPGARPRAPPLPA